MEQLNNHQKNALESLNNQIITNQIPNAKPTQLAPIPAQQLTQLIPMHQPQPNNQATGLKSTPPILKACWIWAERGINTSAMIR